MRIATALPVSLLLAALLVGCSEDAAVDAGRDVEDDDPVPEVETRPFQMGASGLVPRNWPEPSNADWADLFAKIPAYGELWGVHTGWNEGELDETGVPIVVEVAYEHFLDVYAQTYDAIKEVSAATEVGSNFILEYMCGSGALSGTVHEAHWGLLDRFESRADLVSFTVYPFFDYDSPGEIPADYLDVIADHTSLSVMITETGWPSEPISGITGSEVAQVAYFEALADMAERFPVRAPRLGISARPGRRDGRWAVRPHQHAPE